MSSSKQDSYSSADQTQASSQGGCVRRAAEPEDEPVACSSWLLQIKRASPRLLVSWLY
jgi:hypothetical protein